MPLPDDFPYRSQRMPVCARNVVATSQPLAAQAGIEMLRQGGNAVDAAVATAITLTVVEPNMNGIGGDAFALVWDGERLHGLNSSGRSPAAWSPDRFAGMTEMPVLGWDAVTVPGAVAGWKALSEKFGRLRFEKLFEPAVRYADRGFIVSPIVARRWGEAAVELADGPGFREAFLREGQAPAAGEVFRFPEQARTLRRIAESGATVFYRGDLARKIAAFAAECGGALTTDDMAAHQADWVEPVGQDYHDLRLHEVPPNGQGMAALVTLAILNHYRLADYPVDSADSIHLQVEAMKLGFLRTLGEIADPDYMRVSTAELLEPAAIERVAAQIDMASARTISATPPQDQGTVYLTAADEKGMMVSYIQSNYMGFGSGVVVPGTGISMHNRGNAFSLEPGHPNEVGGGKRPFHTIIPAFLTRGGQPDMSFGVMGAHMQPQGHVQMLTRVHDYSQNPQTACDAPRWRVSEDLSMLALETGTDPKVAEALARRGHRVEILPDAGAFGGGQLIRCLDDGYCAASDHRKDGQAVGI